MQEIIVAANEAGQRLDKMLAKYLNEAPKSFLYKMLRKKNIVLNGKKATGNEKLAVGDSVKLFLTDETIAKFSNIHAVHTNVTLDIIYEDENVLLINKPVGMLSQKAAADDESLLHARPDDSDFQRVGHRPHALAPAGSGEPRSRILPQ